MIFLTNHLWSCVFGFVAYKSLGPGTEGLGLKHLSLLTTSVEIPHLQYDFY